MNEYPFRALCINPDYVLDIAHAQHNTITWKSNNTTHMIHYYMCTWYNIVLFKIKQYCILSSYIVVSHNALSFHMIQYPIIHYGIYTILVHWFYNNKTHDAISHHIWRYNLIAYKNILIYYMLTLIYDGYHSWNKFWFYTVCSRLCLVSFYLVLVKWWIWY